MRPPSNIPSQPNLYVATAHRTWPLHFWATTALTGIVAGLVGGILMRTLRIIERISWSYDAGTFLEAVSRSSASRHVLVLLAAGLLVGACGMLIRKLLGTPEDAESAIWFRSGRLRLIPTVTQAVLSIVTVAMGTSLGRESPIKQAGGAIASRIARWAGLSRAPCSSPGELNRDRSTPSDCTSTTSPKKCQRIFSISSAIAPPARIRPVPPLPDIPTSFGDFYSPGISDRCMYWIIKRM